MKVLPIPTSGADHAHHINTCPPRLSDFPPALVLLRLIAACRQRILGDTDIEKKMNGDTRTDHRRDGGRGWDEGAYLHCFLEDTYNSPILIR